MVYLLCGYEFLSIDHFGRLGSRLDKSVVASAVAATAATRATDRRERGERREAAGVGAVIAAEAEAC